MQEQSLYAPSILNILTESTGESVVCMNRTSITKYKDDVNCSELRVLADFDAHHWV